MIFILILIRYSGLDITGSKDVPYVPPQEQTYTKVK